MDLRMQSKSSYYTIEVIEQKQEGKTMIGTERITGHCVDEIVIGEDVNMSLFGTRKVKEIVERRDCKGVFSNPSLNKNSYFEIIVDFIKPIL